MVCICSNHLLFQHMGKGIWKWRESFCGVLASSTSIALLVKSFFHLKTWFPRHCHKLPLWTEIWDAKSAFFWLTGFFSLWLPLQGQSLLRLLSSFDLCVWALWMCLGADFSLLQPLELSVGSLLGTDWLGHLSIGGWLRGREGPLKSAAQMFSGTSY